MKTLVSKIANAIKNSKKILLHNHPSPDGDSYGSALAWAYILKKMGKHVTVIAGDNPPISRFSFLPGFDEVVNKSYLEINPKEYDLFIINDSASISRVSNKGEVLFPKEMKTVVIDHHATNTGFGDINLTVSSIATCEILFDLFMELGFEIDEEVARCLFVGIYTDSGGFKYQGTTSNTFNVAAKLIDKAPGFYKDIFTLENNDEAWLIKFEALLLSSVENYFSGNVAMSTVSYEKLLEQNVPTGLIGGDTVSNRLKAVKGWNLGISFLEKEKNKISVSLRTRDAEKFDLTKLAVALGGGGHKAAAGAKISMPFSDAKRHLLETIQRVYPELGAP